jgi:hypothetical protein
VVTTGVIVRGWIGNAQTIIQSEEIEQLALKHPNGIAEYVYGFQAAILVILATLVLWGLAGLEVFDQPCMWNCPAWFYKATAALLFSLASLTLRECWHVVMTAHGLLLAHRSVKQLPGGGIEDQPRVRGALSGTELTGSGGNDVTSPKSDVKNDHKP